MPERLKGNLDKVRPSVTCTGLNCPYLIKEKGEYYCSHPFERTKPVTTKSCKSMYDSVTGSDGIKIPIPRSP